MLGVRGELVPSKHQDTPNVLSDFFICILALKLGFEEFTDFVQNDLIVVSHQLVCTGKAIKHGAIAGNTPGGGLEELENQTSDFLAA